MSEQLKVCADLSSQERCQYAKIVKEKGEYPIIKFQAKLENDSITISNIDTDMETTCSCVYCMNPSYPKGKFIRGIEPYFPCPVPSDCPLKQCESKSNKKMTIWERIATVFVK